MVVIAAIIIFGGTTFAIIRLQNHKTTPTTVSQPDTKPTTVKQDVPIKDQLNTAQAQKEQSVNQDTQVKTPPSTLSVTITAANQNKSSSLLQIRTLISMVTDTGSCTLTLSKDATTITRSSGIQAGPTNSTCKGFDIPLNELSNGKWSVSVAVTSGSLAGNATTEVTIDAL